MKNRDIYEIRASVEEILRNAVAALDTARVRPRVIVTVNPSNDIDVMVVSSVFQGVDIHDRDDLLWPILEQNLSSAEQDRIDRWDLLTYNEAKKVYPSALRARSSRVDASARQGSITSQRLPSNVRRVADAMTRTVQPRVTDDSASMRASDLRE